MLIEMNLLQIPYGKMCVCLNKYIQYSWPLNSIDMKIPGPFICRFTKCALECYMLHSCLHPGCRTAGSEADCKVIHGFLKPQPRVV